ncbi:MAG: CotH kinase family protein [Verrucomicrobia bacterium]|nr:CotH kinase family protein [Verrucomicrobiota bacterium]
MYHPVERPTFNAEGDPELDLSRDVHEFIELHNPGSVAVNLGGWRLTGGISYRFPPHSAVAPGGFLVVAKNPSRLAAVAGYELSLASVLGPFSGQLGNHTDTVRLRDDANAVVDEVSYSSSFPWAIGADALGAEDEFSGFDSSRYQHRGRSLERVSFMHSAKDPANWLASPLESGPSPGRSNAVHRWAPLPVVVSFTAGQRGEADRMIRANRPVELECRFSGTNELSGVAVEWFVDDIDRTNETRFVASLTAVGNAGGGRYVGLLPGQPDRSVVRFRILGDRGGGVEPISPRKDDPFAWHAYFVSPRRESTRPAYDLFVSHASLRVLATNIDAQPRRVTAPDPPGYPRASWNATEPAVLVCDGVVRDIRVRHHASRFHRGPERNSFRWRFPSYARFEGRSSLFVGNKSDFYIAAHGLFSVAGLPTSRLRRVELYLNDHRALHRMEQEVMDGALLERFHAETHALGPGEPAEAVGELYKCVGLLAGERDGPYGAGDMSRLPAIPPWWTARQRYEWTYRLENHRWKGHRPLMEMIDGLWRARGDSPRKLDPDIPSARAWLERNFDIDATLTYLALRSWAGSFDDTTQNYFLWRRTSGRWALLPWDFDFEFADHAVDCSIYLGEAGVSCNNPYYPGYRPSFLYDAFFKAFRTEFKERLFVLNNTLLHPDNLDALGYGHFLAPGDRITMRRFAETRQPHVNQQLGLGAYRCPRTPVNGDPRGGSELSGPLRLEASPYVSSEPGGAGHVSTTWVVRTRDGDYAFPVARITSTADLTSVAVPSDHLKPGETYLWRCFYTDAKGHPSLASSETSFRFVSPTTR